MSGSVDRTQTEIRGEYLPDDLWLKPDIGFCSTDFDIAPGAALQFQRFQQIVKGL